MRFFAGLRTALLFFPLQGVQAQEASPAVCDCDEVLAFVADYIERNYAGFQDKVPEVDWRRYEEHLDKLRARADGAPAEAGCHAWLQEYAGFFRDRHLGVLYPAASAGIAPSDEAIRARFADWPARRVSEAEVRESLEGSADDLDPIEGIWEFVGADYRVAVLPVDGIEGRYEAVILNADGVWWVPGQIKATLERTAAGEYRADFYARDHSPREETARLGKGILVFSSVRPWARIDPENVSGFDPAQYRNTEANRDFEVRTLDADTLLLRLPSFSPLVQAQIDDLIEANWDRLTRARNLIIDLRGNPGGSNASYRAVQPLLYTGPAVTPGMSHLATDDNIRALEVFLETTDVSADVEGSIREIIARMREHRGAFVPAPDDILTLDAVLPRPSRVAILADRWCASSCEAFVWIALQSGKTTVFGENTGGFLDYGDTMPVETPCPDFVLYNPTSRSNRILQGVPLDNVGIEPHVHVPNEVIYWIEWVREQLQ